MTEAENKKVEDKDEAKERVDAFIVDYKSLIEKHEVDFAAFPQYIPDGVGGFRTIVQTVPVDTRNQPKKSPFVGGAN